jgi:hypothetical protein
MGSATASRSGANSSSPIALTNVRTGLGADPITAALIENLHRLLGKLPRYATRNDWRDRMMEGYINRPRTREFGSESVHGRLDARRSLHDPIAILTE